MNERLRMLRDELDLSRAAFGQRIGVSGDVVNNLERGRVELKEHIVKLICAEFSVSEDWLKTGVGDMFIEPDTFSLDDFVKSRGMTDFELEIVKTYFELDPDTRKMLVNHFRTKLAAADTTTAAEPVGQTTEELEAAYKKSRSDSAPKTGLSASSTGEDTAPGASKVSS